MMLEYLLVGGETAWAALEEPPAAASPGASELPRGCASGCVEEHEDSRQLLAAGLRGAAGAEGRRHCQPARALAKVRFNLEALRELRLASLQSQHDLRPCLSTKAGEGWGRAWCGRAVVRRLVCGWGRAVA